jgi:hypothetical protein
MGIPTNISALLLTAALGTSAAAEDGARTIPPAPANTQTTSASGFSVGISLPVGGISYKAAPVIAPSTSSVDFAACRGGDQEAVKACEADVIQNQREVYKRRVLGEPVNINAAIKTAIPVLDEGNKPADGRFEQDVYYRALLNRPFSPKP